MVAQVYEYSLENLRLMRRASRLAAFSGANVITSEVAGALCASLQMRQSGFQPVHVSDSNGAPLCVVKNKNRLSVSRILLFGPEHHALQQEKQRQPRRRRPRQPDPHSVEPVRQGASSISSCGMSLLYCVNG